MKKIFVMFLAVVLVFCVFTGCEGMGGNQSSVGNANVGGNQSSGDDANIIDNAGEADAGDNAGDDKPKYKIVTPISDGGSYSGGDY